MKRILPILLIFVIALSFLFSNIPFVHADTPTPTPLPALGVGTTPAPTGWQPDPEVTFVGKTASRSGDFLDWTLQNYNWLCVAKKSENNCDNTNDPLIPFWVLIRNIVFAMVALFVLGTAFILVITRGQNITVMRFIPRFVFIVLLVAFSFSLVQFIYQISDIVQGFFLSVKSVGAATTHFITTSDLLYMGFDYKNFVGYRLMDPSGVNDESAFITLLLVRLTAITYYVMTGILLIRKIILWFFIIISPIFPLLLFYKPIRNTAKIWVGEYFRWLLYAPLFAVFLHGLVVVWQSGLKLLPFDTVAAGDASKIIYPTAVNILIGGPGQTIGINNSVNLRDTFALYVVALLMLWVAILLPFLLLKIFLDYLNTISFGNNVVLKQAVNRGMSFFSGPKGVPPGSPIPPPGQTQPAGQARSLPLYASRGAAIAPVQVKADVQASARESSDVLKLANLSIPKMRDIAKYETSMLSKDTTVRSEASQFKSNLTRIANPNTAIVTSERDKFTTVRQQLLEQKQKGNPIASSVLKASEVITNTNVTSQKQQTPQTFATSLLSASQIGGAAGSNVQNRQQQITNIAQSLTKIARPETLAIPAEREKFIKLKEQLLKEKEKGNALASSILDTSEKVVNKDSTLDQKTKAENELIDRLLEQEEKANQSTTTFGQATSFVQKTQALPSVNRIQQVSLEDYEQVRSLWTENYQTVEPPKDLSGRQFERREWIKNDIDKITQAVALINSIEPERVDQGMNMVANILPFLLIGGFSKTEVVAYLKAKMEAGKSVLTNLQQKENEEESMVSTGKKVTAEAGHMSAAEKIEKPVMPTETSSKPSDENRPNPETVDPKTDESTGNGDEKNK